MHIDMKFIMKILLFALVIGLAACAQEKPVENANRPQPVAPAGAAPSGPGGGGEVGNAQYGLELRPAEVWKNSTLAVAPRGFNLAGAKVEWLVNGAPVENPLVVQYKASDVAKGDAIQVRALINGIEIKSNEVRVRNSPPAVGKVRIMPEIFKPGDTLYVEVTGNDPDNDPLTFLYEWTRNGEPAGTGQKIEGGIKRGDAIAVKITPFDGEVYGRPVVLNAGIRNMPPVIAQHNKINFDGKVLTYQVKASDPDGDPLTYALKEGPTGMTINADSGLVTWNVPAEFKGSGSFTVIAKDGQGGETSYTANVTIKSEAIK